MNKVLFFDVDGTLLNSKKEIPESTIKALNLARRNGYEIAIATGRAPFMIESILEQLKIDSFISFNGQYVVYKDKPIFIDGVQQKELKKIIEYGAAENISYVFLDDKEMVATKEGCEKVKESLSTLKFPYPRVNESFYESNQVYQTLAFIEEEQEERYKKEFPNVQFIRWHRYACDIIPKEGSKARGIQKFMEAANVSIEHTVAFGDGLNDIEMLEAAGIGVAMGNGHPLAKQAANIIAPHVDDDGIYKVMKQLNII